MSMLSKLCEDLRNAADEGYCPNRDRLLMRDAAETIECLSAKVRANNLHDGWIPCSERLPEEEYKSYWICTDNGYQCECRWTNVNRFWTELTTDWHWNMVDVPQYSKVTAWMSLPEPYKDE